MSDEIKKNIEKMSIEELDKAYCQPRNSIVHPLLNDDVHVTSLIIYPVKGCMAFPVSTWPMHEAGLYLDRHWCIKSTKSDKYLDISKYANTLIIYPYIDLANKLLILSAPGINTNLVLTIYDDEFQANEGGELHSIVLENNNLGYTLEDCGEEAAFWINDVLSRDDCKLIRQVKLRDNNLSLSCDSHIQIINISSLEDLSEKISLEQGFLTTSLVELCLRFRPNIVVGGLKKYEEATLDTLSIKGVQLKGDELMVRCKAVNLDLEKYDYEAYPLKYLVKAGKGKAEFGLHTFVIDCNQNQMIEVGDKIKVHSYKE